MASGSPGRRSRPGQPRSGRAIWLLVLLLVATDAGLADHAAGNTTPSTGGISAFYNGAVTSFGVSGSDPDGEAMRFKWTLTGNDACKAAATWSKALDTWLPSGPLTDPGLVSQHSVIEMDHEACEHLPGSEHHGGTIQVTVTDGNGHCFVTVYTGPTGGGFVTETGDGDPGTKTTCPELDENGDPVGGGGGDGGTGDGGDGGTGDGGDGTDGGTDGGDGGTGETPAEPCDGFTMTVPFEPTQAVWQDDDEIPDLPGKRIVQDTSVTTHTVYDAELPMVDGRRTLIFGQAGSPRSHHNHFTLHFSGNTTGTTAADITVQFSLDRPGQVRKVLEIVDLEGIPLLPPCGPSTAWAATEDATIGLPTEDPFLMTGGAGTYTLSAQAAYQAPLDGALVEVRGEVVEIEPPSVLIAPTLSPEIQAKIDDASFFRALAGHPANRLLIAATGASEAVAETVAHEDHATLGALRRLATNAEALRTEASLEMPRAWPVPADPYPISVGPIVPVGSSDAAAEALELCVKAKIANGGTVPSWCTGSRAYNGLILELQRLARGAGHPRVLGLIDERSTLVEETAWPTFGVTTVQPEAAFVASDKALLSIHLGGHLPFGAELVLTDELALTIPTKRGPGGLDAACGADISAVDEDGFEERQLPGQPGHRRIGISLPTFADLWFDQCTYWHLTNNLNKVRDPPIVHLEGLLLSNATLGLELGAITSGETDVGLPTLTNTSTGDFSLVLRDASAGLLARYNFSEPFRAPGTSNSTIDQSLAPFSHSIETPPGVAQVQLVGPSSVLDTLNVSATPPTVLITSQAPGGNLTVFQDRLQVNWTTFDADGDNVTSRLLFSPDGGTTWLDTLTNGTHANGSIPPAYLEGLTDGRIRVIVTDGYHAANHTIPVEVPGYPPPALSGLAVATGPTSAQLTFRTDDVALGYIGWADLAGDENASLQPCRKLFGREQVCQLTNLTPETTYEYLFGAVDPHGFPGNDGTVRTFTTMANSTPLATTRIELSAVANGSRILPLSELEFDQPLIPGGDGTSTNLTVNTTADAASLLSSMNITWGNASTGRFLRANVSQSPGNQTGQLTQLNASHRVPSGVNPLKLVNISVLEGTREVGTGNLTSIVIELRMPLDQLTRQRPRIFKHNGTAQEELAFTRLADLDGFARFRVEVTSLSIFLLGTSASGGGGLGAVPPASVTSTDPGGPVIAPDGEGPRLLDLWPRASATVQAIPFRIDLRYDDPLGIDAEATLLIVDGQPVEPTFVLDHRLLWVPVPTLEPGEHQAHLLLVDAAGAVTEHVWSFTVAPGSLPPSVAAEPADRPTGDPVASKVPPGPGDRPAEATPVPWLAALLSLVIAAVRRRRRR